jgi:2-oxoglutarate ferredoxin oxidoreductase subunit beta
VAPDYDPTNRQAAQTYLQDRLARGEVATGLLFVDQGAPDMHDLNDTTSVPLSQVPYEKLCPGRAVLDKLQEAFR